jgi:uncharacterized protein YbaP (TraB family)
MRILTLGALALAFAHLAAAAAPLPACTGKDLTEVAGLAQAMARRADDLVNADGLLWRIEKPGLAPSFLFGTIHSTDDAALALARRAAERIQGAKVVATELGSLDPGVKADILALVLARALDRDSDTLDALRPEDQPRLEALAAAKGFGGGFAHHLKLWFLAILTATPACETRRQAEGLPEVDEYLAATAKDAGVKVIGLETIEEQIDTIASMPPDLIAALLTVAAREPERDGDVYATLLRLYRESRPADILPIVDVVGRLTDDERAAEEEFSRRLLAGRNATMAERAAPLLAGGGAFLAVGALHLTGKDGLIERVRAKGYRVTKEW